MCKQSERLIGNGYIEKGGAEAPFFLSDLNGSVRYICFLVYTQKNLFLAFLYKVHKVVKKKLCICWTA